MKKRRRCLGFTPAECVRKLNRTLEAAERKCVRVYGKRTAGPHHVCVSGVRIVGELWDRV